MTLFENVADLQAALTEIRSVRQTIPWDDDRREQLMKAEGKILSIWKRLDEAGK